MMGKYIVYFDSGTSNSRIYLLDKDFQVLYVDKKNVGSRNSSIEGSNRVLIEGLYELYTKLLQEKHLTEEDVTSIYMSGMITSPYGMKEVPHLKVPLSVQEFADSLYCHYEDTLFHRNIYLVPGLKTVNDDFSFVGNMRGEEIEIIGTLDELRSRGITHAALMMPGSHTHVTYVKDDVVSDIISNFTGELFYALKKETIMAPILGVEATADDLDPDMIHKALENLERHTEAHTALLREASSRRKPYPTQAQMEALARDVAEIRAILRQAGKRNEKRFSLRGIRLPRLSLPDIPWTSLLLGLAALALTGLVLWVVWSSLDTLWSAAKGLLP